MRVPDFFGERPEIRGTPDVRWGPAKVGCGMETGQAKPHFSLPSLIAIGAAIASFFACAGAGFLLALIGIGFGILGVLRSVAPSVRGGFVSILSLIAGAIGIFVAIIKVFL